MPRNVLKRKRKYPAISVRLRRINRTKTIPENTHRMASFNKAFINAIAKGRILSLSFPFFVHNIQ